MALTEISIIVRDHLLSDQHVDQWVCRP